MPDNISVNIKDRWHLTRAPKDPGAVPCKCGRGRNKLYPAAEHKQGDRWQVQWREPGTSLQKSANRPLKEGADPDVHADAYASEIEAQLRGHGKKRYVDPALKAGTLGAYAETWRKGRIHDTNRARNLESRLRLHVYEDPDHPGRTRRGGPALGHLTWAQIDQYVSLTQAWIAGLGYLAPVTARGIIGDVSTLYTAAVEDGLLSRDVTKSPSIQRPKAAPKKARAWTEEETVAMEEALPRRFKILQRLGPALGVRQGEMFALAVDDVDFLKPADEKEIRIDTQVKRVNSKLVYSPLKNRKPHAVPVADELVADISAHLAEFPAARVMLPWHDTRDKERHGQMVTRRLIVTDFGGGAIDAAPWGRRVWKVALAAAGLIPQKGKGSREKYVRDRQRGTHAAWRHTAASQWLADGVEVTAVAEWIGDTVKVVVETYLHMMPSATGRGRAAMGRHLQRLDQARSGAGSSARNVPVTRAE